MSSGNIKRVYHKIKETSGENIIDFDIDYTKIIIPFSKVFKSFKRSDIYSGNEKIPFNKRDPEYRMILRQEFTKL